MIRFELVRYLAVGVANTAIGYGVIVLLHLYFGVNAIASNAAGYLVGFFVSYGLNRRYTFRSNVSHRHSIPAFVAAAAVCYFVNLAVLQVSLSIFRYPAAASQALAVGVYTVLFYFLSRYLVFAKADDQGASQSTRSN